MPAVRSSGTRDRQILVLLTRQEDLMLTALAERLEAPRSVIMRRSIWNSLDCLGCLKRKLDAQQPVKGQRKRFIGLRLNQQETALLELLADKHQASQSQIFRRALIQQAVAEGLTGADTAEAYGLEDSPALEANGAL